MKTAPLMAYPSPARRGFSLIELAMVVVVIALVAGGVVVGGEMLGSAKLRAQVGEFEEVRMAVATFKSKYGALPSDWLAEEANRFFPNICNKGGHMCNGDENGIIMSGGASGQPGSYEVRGVWMQLAGAGLLSHDINISANYGGTSLSGYGGNLLSRLDKRDSMAVYYDNIAGSTTNRIITSKTYTPVQGKQLDLKIDDGHPSNGNFRGTGQYNDGMACLTVASAHKNMAYASVRNADYDTTLSTISCILFVDFKGI